MSFAENLKKYMKQNNITAAEISEKLDITRAAVTNWSNGIRFPKDDKRIMALASILRVGVEDLFNDSDLKPIARVPVIGEASCGSAITSSFQETGRTCYYRGDFFHPDLYCVLASGDSMAPEIEDGDEIVCDPRVQPAHGDLVHYSIHGESAIKVYVVDNDAHLLQFVPYNPSDTFKTRTIRLDDEEASELKVVKVVAVNKLKFNNKSARLKLIGRV
ncbi:MAG: LexA family transcriptional regulator [Sulfuricurvum sp.]|nr:LexA family transcriptional regulator [Sulfuricurvum sp.]